MTEQELWDLANSMSTVTTNKLEFRAYYDVNGKIITYTSEKLDGSYIVITPEQYAEARSDSIVKDGELVYTHKLSHVYKLIKKNQVGVMTSKYDVNIIVEESDDVNFWNYESHSII